MQSAPRQTRRPAPATRRLTALLMMGGLLGSLSQSGIAAAATAKPTVLLVGDSTMAPNTGYGNALCERLQPAVDCVNLGRGGRSTLSYRTEGLWDSVLTRVKALATAAEPSPTYVLIQFGHNDQPGKPGRSTDLATEYPANLKRFITELRAAGGVPVLVTPLTRRSFDGDKLNDQLKPWADAMKAVAKSDTVPLVDLHALSMAAVQPLGQAGADALAEAAPGQPRFDRTHVGPKGACVFAEIVSRDLTQQVSALDLPRSAAPDCRQLRSPAETFSVGQLDTPGWTSTVGGRGGQIIKVTTLAASGPGSLKAAIETPGPRIVVFEVGGVIDMAGAPLEIKHPYLTIAGQTAPNPGISIIKAETTVNTHDVVIQHLRFRPGEFGRPKQSGNDQDGLSTLAGAHDVIVDHCSFSWATDENLSASGPRFAGSTPEEWRTGTSHRITYSHNLIYEGLSHSVHVKGEHSKGSLIHDNTSQVLLFGNVYASNRERNALFKGGTQGAMVNNLIVNPGRLAVHYNLWPKEWEGHAFETGRLSLVGNVLRHGPDTEAGTALFTLRGAGDLALHMADNLAFDTQGKPVALSENKGEGGAKILPQAQSGLPAGLRIRPAAQLADELLPAVGARPWDRDALDLKVLAEVKASRGRIIDSEKENALGYPTASPTRRSFDPEAWLPADMSPKSGWASLWGASVEATR